MEATSTGCRRGRSTIWWRLGSRPGSPSPRSAASVPSSTSSWGRSVPESGPHRVPLRVLDATYLKGRVNHQVVSRAVVVAPGLTMDGHGEMLGCAVGTQKTGLLDRVLALAAGPGPRRGRLVISDQHLGLEAAVEAVMVGSAWQRRRVNCMRNVLTRVKRKNTHMVNAAIQTIFAQPDARAVREQFDRIVDPRRPVRRSGHDAHDARRTSWPSPPSRRPLAQGLVDQSAGAPPPRDQATDRRGRGVPQRCIGRTARHGRGGEATTNGRWPNAVICLRPRWPCSGAWRRQPSRKH